jgi:hypothetical protein
MEVHTALIKLVKDFLNERTQSVCISSTIGSPKPVLNGTTQGTLLGPLFWLMYVDDLETPYGSIIKYADDMTVTTSTATQLQESINVFSDWCKEHYMVANTQKSISMTISNKRVCSNSQSMIVTLNGEQMPQKDTTKFLGVMIDQHLTFEDHVTAIISKLRSSTYIILKLKRSGVPIKQLKQYYISYCLSVIT